ncbi:MAG TPA: hypothetical protein VMF52_10215 [Steroidobacteraceae bacterium]|nr:hypothetical protein [Steroidobacteraceae bacterium]
MLIAIVSVLMTFFGSARQLGMVGLLSLIGTLILQVWIFKYCYVLIGHLANGRDDPPVLDLDMLSPFEIRPWVQVAVIAAAGGLCWVIGGKAGVMLGLCFLLLLPASIALLGYGEMPWQAANPLALYRVVRGLGPYYLGLIGAMLLYALVAWFVASRGFPLLVSQAVNLTLEISFFGLIGGALYFRRRQLGFEAQVSPERTAAREEREREQVRARMLDDVFTQVRIGKHVDSTRPLADWFRGLDGDVATRDAVFVAEQAIAWQIAPALNPIGSTLIRHLLRAGRPDSALEVFRLLRAQSRTFTMDSADDLRSLADYAESGGDPDLAASMRLETPVFHPRR